MPVFAPGLAAAFVVGCSLRSSPPVLGVSVERAGEDVKTLSDSELAEFAKSWNNKTPIDDKAESRGGDQFALDIDFGNGRESWIYYSTGRVTRLSMKQKAVYDVPDPEQFNRLIGAASADPSAR